MKARTHLERWLLGATIASGIMVVFSHGGGTTGCATSQQRVEGDDPHFPLLAGHQALLVLKHTLTSEGATIDRGTVIEIAYDASDGSKKTAIGPLVGVVPEFGTVIINDEGDRRELPASTISSIAVVGEHPRGRNITRGALIGGLVGAAVGGIAGAGVGGAGSGGNSGFGAICAVGFAIPAGGVGSGVGIGVGAAASPGRTRTAEYKIGAGAWQVDRGRYAWPASSSPAAAPSTAPSPSPSPSTSGAP